MKNMTFTEKKYILVYGVVIITTLLFLINAVNDVASVRYKDSFKESLTGQVQIEDVRTELMGGKLLVIPSQKDKVLSLSFSADNRTEIQQECKVYLLNDALCIIDGEILTLEPGQSGYAVSLDSYRNVSETSAYYCLLETAAYENVIFDGFDVESSGFRSGYGVMEIFVVIVAILIILAAVVAMVISARSMVKDGHFKALLKRDMKEPAVGWLKEHREYFIVALIILAGVVVLFRNVDITIPLQIAHVSDDKWYLFNTKEIMEGHINLTYSRAGGIFGFEQFDFPNTDKLQTLVIALFGLCSDNPYTVTNLFYFSCFFLVGITACYSGRKLGLGRAGSILVGVLYAFSPFILKRYYHLWLCAYFMLPLAVLVSVEAMLGKNDVYDEKGRRIYLRGLMIAFLCAFTELYYAYFSCALFSVTIIYCLINDEKGKKLKHFVSNFTYIVMTVAGCFVCVIPNLLYWYKNPINADNDFFRRPAYQTEQYGLRIAQMLLPSDEHRIPFLRNITLAYENSFDIQNVFVKKLFINENVSATIGIIAVIGLVFSFVSLIKKNENGKAKCLGILSAFTLFIATVGGGSSIIQQFVSVPVRSYNRMSLVIMFCALLVMAFVLEKATEKLAKRLSIIVFVAVMLIGFFDQTSDYSQNQAFYNVKQFFREVAEERNPKMRQNIFALPYLDWPDQGNRLYFIGLTEGVGDVWSSPAPEGRDEAVWQAFITGLDTPQMMESLRNCGYTGLYMDVESYELAYDDATAEEALASVVSVLGPPLVSDDVNKLYYWDLYR